METPKLILTFLTLPHAYIPDVKLHLTSVLPQRCPVRHSVRRIDFPSCGTCLNWKPRSLEPHKPVKGCWVNTLRSSATDPLAWFEYNVVRYNDSLKSKCMTLLGTTKPREKVHTIIEHEDQLKLTKD
ncbi:hypothetical protein AVEN_57912-1 [Araneus ventricosus]|uniref:Uncharacterized protein n=1 Tax=Araneus ventricosus TaxID=182803 RepID=A0A4Y2KJM8_ARAVE|nr:hypothetical protein AVEN_57912-1 [Araneus ventricosus]